MAEPTCQAPLDVLKRSGLSDDKCAHLTKVPNSLVDLLKGIHEDHWALVLDHIDHAVEPFRLQSQLASTSLGSLSSTPKYFPAPSNQSGSTNLPPQIDIPPSALKPPSAIRTPLPSQSRLIALSQNSENSAANYSIPQRTLNSTSTVHAPSVSHSRLIAPYPNSERFTASYSIPRSTLRLPSAIHPPPSSQSRLIAPSPNCEPSTTNHSTPAPSAPNMASHSPPQGLKRRLSFLGAEPSKKKAARGSGRLQDIGWALNDKITREDLQIRRDQFYKKLEAIEVERAKGNKKQAAASKKKILQTVIDVTNFFFDEVMGPDSFKRVASLIADYNARNYNQIGSNAVTRAVYLASINGIPTVVRSFYTSFANAERFNANSSNNYARLLKSIYDVELYKSFLSLHYSVEMRDPSLVQFLESKGLKTAIGRGYRSLVMKYLQRELGFDEERAELQNRFQAGQGLAQVVKHSSEGVLILLPPGTETRLKAWGVQRMTHTYRLLRETIPEFADVCKAAYDLFYVPITTSQTLNFQQLKNPTSLSQVFLTTNRHANTSTTSATPHAITPIPTFNQQSDPAFSRRGPFNTLRATAPAPTTSQRNLSTSSTHENRSIGYFATVLAVSPAPTSSQRNVLAPNTPECRGA